MQTLEWSNLQRILCLGAHSDDIEMGCGATLMEWLEKRPDVEIQWVVFSAEGDRRREAEQAARSFLRASRRSEVVVQDFRGSYFPHQGATIKDFMETLKPFQPDLVFTHYREDRHQDHRVISDLAWNTFRNHTILEYEIPKYDGDLGAPNFFVPVTRARCEQKANLLMKHFGSQSNKHWFTPELFMALPRLRGMECASPTEYAEAFYSRKLVSIVRETGGSREE